MMHQAVEQALRLLFSGDLMAIHSMTGFGRGTAAARGIRVMVELKSVNHRQFDCRIDLPPPLGEWEVAVREQIHESIARGSIACKVVLDVSPVIRRQSATVDEALARAYLARLRQIAGRLGLKDDLSSASLLNLPGVVSFESPAAGFRSCRTLIRIGLNKAIKALNAMREREGRTLGRDIADRLKRLQALMLRIERRAPGVAPYYRQALLKRIHEAGLNVNAEDPRLLKEIALYADRSDISEEITRLRSHFQQCVAVIATGELAGRPLDFLVQELFREINTIGSKANDRVIASEVIRFKAELERIREQVQNIA